MKDNLLRKGMAGLLCLLLAASLGACGQGTEEQGDDSASSVQSEGVVPNVDATTSFTIGWPDGTELNSAVAGTSGRTYSDREIAAVKEFQTQLEKTVDWKQKKVVATVNGEPIYDAQVQIARLQLEYTRQITDLSLYTPEQQAEMQKTWNKTEDDLLREQVKKLALIQQAYALGTMPSDEAFLANANAEGVVNAVTITGEEGDFMTAFVQGLGMDRETFVREIWVPNLKGMAAQNWVQQQFLQEHNAQAVNETEELQQEYRAYLEQVQEDLLSKADVQYVN